MTRAGPAPGREGCSPGPPPAGGRRSSLAGLRRQRAVHVRDDVPDRPGPISEDTLRAVGVEAAVRRPSGRKVLVILSAACREVAGWHGTSAPGRSAATHYVRRHGRLGNDGDVEERKTAHLVGADHSRPAAVHGPTRRLVRLRGGHAARAKFRDRATPAAILAYRRFGCTSAHHSGLATGTSPPDTVQYCTYHSLWRGETVGRRHSGHLRPVPPPPPQLTARRLPIRDAWDAPCAPPWSRLHPTSLSRLTDCPLSVTASTCWITLLYWAKALGFNAQFTARCQNQGSCRGAPPPS
jgi:hypothetical protein